MFKELSIENFKAFSSIQNVKLAPITLIYGPNSSGKSSIVHSIMLLKQSITTPSEIGGLVSNGQFVDLGDYSSMVHGHDLGKEIKFSFKYSPTKKSINDASAARMFGSKQDRSYSLTYANIENTQNNKVFSILKEMKIEVTNTENESEILRSKFSNDLTINSKSNIEGDPKIFRLSDSWARQSMADYLDRRLGRDSKDNKDESKLFLDSVDFMRDLNFSTPSMAMLEGKFKESRTNMHRHFFLSMTMSELATDLKEKFNSVSYLGPLRSHPSRFYSPRGDQEVSVGKEGENVARFIYEKSPGITESINKWFKDFEIPYKLSAESIGNDVTGTVICLQLEDERTGFIVGPSDVGFGIGQILPVIVEGIVRNDGVICVEQPEIHLHPRLQANLTNFIVDTCDSNQWIIETHSEALMLRLQNKIRQGKIRPEQVSIVYVDPTSSGGKVIHIPLDKDGDFLEEWPDGFFEERIKEKKRKINDN